MSLQSSSLSIVSSCCLRVCRERIVFNDPEFVELQCSSHFLVLISDNSSMALEILSLFGLFNGFLIIIKLRNFNVFVRFDWVLEVIIAEIKPLYVKLGRIVKPLYVKLV